MEKRFLCIVYLYQIQTSHIGSKKAFRYVYADAKQKGMLAIKPRRVDKVLFEKEKKTIAVWHKDQISRERSFFENNT